MRSPYKGGACRPGLSCLPAITFPSNRISSHYYLTPSTPLLIHTELTYCVLRPRHSPRDFYVSRPPSRLRQPTQRVLPEKSIPFAMRAELLTAETEVAVLRAKLASASKNQLLLVEALVAHECLDEAMSVATDVPGGSPSEQCRTLIVSACRSRRCS